MLPDTATHMAAMSGQKYHFNPLHRQHAWTCDLLLRFQGCYTHDALFLMFQVCLSRG